MNTKLSILFYVKRAKSNSQGLAPIYLRVTINGERIEFAAKRFIQPDRWSVEGNKVKGTSAEARTINSYLDTLKSSVYDYQQQLIREGEEVNAENIKNKTFATDRLNQVKDIFLFSCFTGLAYSDVQKLSSKNISIGIDGGHWIYVNRTQTDTRSNIPLLPIAESILQKYKDHPQVVNQDKLLPILSNQKMNAYLKEIADICEINKELTFHCSRHTFATTVTLSNGVPIESVSKMLQDSSVKLGSCFKSKTLFIKKKFLQILNSFIKL